MNKDLRFKKGENKVNTEQMNRWTEQGFKNAEGESLLRFEYSERREESN